MTTQLPSTQVTSRSLDELFAADPESLTNDELDLMVAKMRDARKLWVQAEKTGGKTGAVAKPDGSQLKLEDLGL